MCSRRKTATDSRLVSMSELETDIDTPEDEAPASGGDSWFDRGPESRDDGAHDGPLVDRERPRRRPLVPRVVFLGAAAFAVLASVAIAFGGWALAGASVAVPDVTGLTEGVARTRIAQAGLTLGSVERRFDEQPAGTVLSQFPDAELLVRRGTSVALVVSAGTEEFVMPDVLGLGITVARGLLEQAGLVVRIEAVESEEPIDTVVETVPAPGARVRTSEIVRVRIAAEGTTTSALLPFRMEGLLFVIDPAPPANGDVDITFEVSRRLRSLVEASGGRVVVTRSANETDAPAPVRAERAVETTEGVTAFIGLDAPEMAPGGLAVLVRDAQPPGTPDPISAILQDALVATLSELDVPVQRVSLEQDVVSEGFGVPAARVRLGALAVNEDVAAFRDPTWSDGIARAIYRALGERFGSR